MKTSDPHFDRKPGLTIREMEIPLREPRLSPEERREDEAAEYLRV